MTQAVPEGKFADIGGGLRIHYHEAGEGTPVVFFHGSGPGASGWSNFRRNYPAFAAAGFHAYVPDTLGFGYSSKPDVDYTMDFIVASYLRFFDKLGLRKAALVGNSHGGAVCIAFALKYPERVSKLILMGPGGLEERETYMNLEGIKTMLRVIFKEGVSRESLRKIFGLQLFDPSQITDEIIEERFQIAETQPKRVMQTLSVPHLAPELSGLEMPVLAFWGMVDRFCPPSGAMRIAAACPNARVMLLSRCGHWVMVEHTELFNRMSTEFLREQS